MSRLGMGGLSVFMAETIFRIISFSLDIKP